MVQVYTFKESHVNERLRKLCLQQDTVTLPRGVNFDLNKAPFIFKSYSSTKKGETISSEYDKEIVELTEVGSSVLLSSFPTKLVQRAFQNVNGNRERLRVKIVKKESGILGAYSNRRYTSLKVLNKHDQHRDAIDLAKNNFLHPKAVITQYNAPRNAPMFVNIREEVSEYDGNRIHLLTGTDTDLPDKINSSYWVGLFKDSICDGCVIAGFDMSESVTGNSITNKLFSLPILPAFSVVTAPDFFPIVESYDMKDYDDLFLSGGVQDTSGARLKANPNVNLPNTKQSAFPSHSGIDIETNVENTVLAIITGTHNPKGIYRGDAYSVNQANSQTRSNFLPDSATLIFYPGWDITYSGQTGKRVITSSWPSEAPDEASELYYSTIGLGSPFMEDSKLCAAANGMWAAASPDAARTFRGSLTGIPTKGRPPTAVPLLDIEIGLHSESPAVQYFQQPVSTGWDGEQGPFITKNVNRLLVNFTNVGRSDYVQKAMNNEFDMSQMRKITVAEIRYRMGCLKRCYQKLKTKDLWLVGMEKVVNWTTGANGYCIPKNIFESGLQWARPIKLNEVSDGYLYLFAKTYGDPQPILDSVRMTQECQRIYICLVTRTATKICTMSLNNKWIQNWT